MIPVPVLHEEPRQLGAGAGPRFTKQADEREHYLLLDSGEPVLLDPGKLFVIGRDQRASLVLRAPGVSRQHCEIDWQGETPRAVLCEIRSRYGTYLNGRIVRRDQPEPLRDGDEIRVGPVLVMQYRWSTERALKENLVNDSRSETTEVRLPPPPSAAPAPEPPLAPPRSTGSWQALPPSPQPSAPVAETGGEEEGNFAQSPPSVVFESLNRNKRSGTLTIFDVSGTGEVTIREGKASSITFASLAGREALQRVLALATGVYRFRPEGARPLPESVPRAVVPPTLNERLSGTEVMRRIYLPQPASPPQPVPVPPYGAPSPQPPPSILNYPGASTAAPPPGLGYPQPGVPVPPQGYGAPPRQTQSYAPPLPNPGYGVPPIGPPPRPTQSYGGIHPLAALPPPPQPLPSDEGMKALITPILATIQAANLTGEGLGGFGGESAAQFLRDGELGAALEVCERVLELAQSSPPAEAAQARNALKGIMRQHVTRALELLEHGLTTRGASWAAPQALRLLKLFDRDMPAGFEAALQALARM
jgi:pSer/pThr/pTyr-binding forkhead associated (FHA) protein